ncbi:glycosyltransferase [Lentisphaerota bacterium ZTH]|nr:glycosyltransferase [Lentisphaerota bacterium]WET05153.1 glycosyltransferase [Lentisphaerota bacterium ZTH]
MDKHKIKIHKHREYRKPPKVSLILLDWEVREYFQALHWLEKQDIKREDYELIWVELYNRTPDIVLEKADTVITCGYTGRYHKHVAYNAGLLQARGDLITIVDSDAVFPENFISSILSNFDDDKGGFRPLVLMHYEARTNIEFPGNDQLKSLEQIKNFPWQKLWENVGACMTVRKVDAINFGGFDEHKNLRGFYCGPYDLGWRMINAGIHEKWEDPDTCLIWHFAHPAPHSSAYNIPDKNNKKSDPHNLHLTGHAFVSVESFSSGRLLPKKENSAVHSRRMSSRRIGSVLEARYANLCSNKGFSRFTTSKVYLINRLESIGHKINAPDSTIHKLICKCGLEKSIPLITNLYKKMMNKMLNN